jgi:KUP system potassium uptake protein
MIALSTAAAVIASQALISGAFSLTRAAVQLGLLPRTRVVHTSAEVEGQIYLPTVNAALWAGCSVLVLAFRSSSGLAAAYGLAVMGVVVVTTLATAVVARERWRWSAAWVGGVFAPLLVFDTAYLGANVVKIPDGAWMPLALAVALFATMRVWSTGRTRVAAAYRRLPRMAVSELVAARPDLVEMPRAMVFLVSEPVRTPADPVPVLLLRFLGLHGALPRHVTLFTVAHEADVPRWTNDRFEVAQLGEGLTAVVMHVGYLEQPDLRAALQRLKDQRAIRIHATRWTIVVGREEILLDRELPLRHAWARVFQILVASSAQVHRWFGLASDVGVSRIGVPVHLTPDGMRVVLDAPGLVTPPRAADIRRRAR